MNIMYTCFLIGGLICVIAVGLTELQIIQQEYIGIGIVLLGSAIFFMGCYHIQIKADTVEVSSNG